MRRCPNCSKNIVPTKELLFGDSQCANCACILGVHRIAAMGFSVVIFAVTLSTTTIVLAQQGIYAALLWFSFPIGALSYIKARFSPLIVRQ